MRPGGPYQLLVEIGPSPLVPSPAANARGGLELNDVLVGEVVLASSFTDAEKESDASVSSPHPFAFVRVFSASAEGTPRRWRLAGQDSVSAPSSAMFRLGAHLAAHLHMPAGIIETSNGQVCSDQGGCVANGLSQMRNVWQSQEATRWLRPNSGSWEVVRGGRR
jgi:hypothetical protein